MDQEQAIKDVCLIARNAIDRITVLERKRNKKWVGLTDEEMTELVLSQGRFGTRLGYVTRTEAKLKEKNGG